MNTTPSSPPEDICSKSSCPLRRADTSSTSQAPDEATTKFCNESCAVNAASRRRPPTSGARTIERFASPPRSEHTVMKPSNSRSRCIGSSTCSSDPSCSRLSNASTTETAVCKEQDHHGRAGGCDQPPSLGARRGKAQSRIQREGATQGLRWCAALLFTNDRRCSACCRLRRRGGELDP